MMIDLSLCRSLLYTNYKAGFQKLFDCQIRCLVSYEKNILGAGTSRKRGSFGQGDSRECTQPNCGDLRLPLLLKGLFGCIYLGG